ncbi:MAG: phosphotransferase [Acidisphaera sp.]|nr:phosphotransferase [Acidisphaera sp.]
MTRSDIIARFLAKHGYGSAERQTLAADASFRRYLRITGGPLPAVLMDAPPGQEDARPFLRIRAHLAGLGLSVPEVLAADVEAGLVLLGDLGDALFPAVLTEENCFALYDAATDALAAMHAAPPPADLPPWDGSAMARAAEATFLDWWWPDCFGAPASKPVRQAFGDALAALLAPLAALRGFVHRDYFADNLFWLPDRPRLTQVGIIDFQDAAIGHPAYDLAALVQDARRDLPDGLAERQVGRYLTLRPELDEAAFRSAFAVAAAHRHLRVAALWLRLARRDGKPGYLRHGPRTWRLLERAVAHPAAAPLAAFLDRWVAPERRASPATRAA